MKYLIRNEKVSDFRKVEELTRRAFWNVYSPGCNEHYLVHTMRNHKDFVPELDFVMEINNNIIGSIMYTKATLEGKSRGRKEILTFGPVCIDPNYQRQGYGKKIIEYSFDIARKIGFDVVAIFGNPCNYASLGFKSCFNYLVSVEDGTYPSAFLVKELRNGTLDSDKWTYFNSDIYRINTSKVELFDKSFEKLVKKTTSSQEEFYILSNSRIFKEGI